MIELIIFAVPLVAILFLSEHPALGDYKNTALNPMYLLAAYCLLVAADFNDVRSTGWGYIAGMGVSVVSETLISLEIRHAAILVSLCVGIGTGFAFKSRSPANNGHVPQAIIKNYTLVSYLSILTVWVLMYRNVAGDNFSLEEGINRRTSAIGDLPLYIATLFLLPSFTFMIAQRTLKIGFPIMLISGLLLIVSGSRTRIIFLLIPFAFYLVRACGVRLPRITFVIGVLSVGFIAMVVANYRYSINIHTSDRVGSIFDVSNLLHSNDVSFAEAGILLERTPRTAVEPYFGSNLIGFLAAPLPRSIAFFRPPTGSAEYTAAVDPANWYRFHRELTIGGLNEIMFDYWLPVAFVVAIVLGAAWGFCFKLVSRSSTLGGFAWTVCLYSAVYTFLKADLQTTGRIVWGFLFYYAFIYLLQTSFVRSTERYAGVFRRHRSHT